MGELPDHLRPTFRVNDGLTTHVSRDLPELRTKLGRQVQATLTQATTQQNKTGTTWVFGAMPVRVTLRRGDIEAPAFPALQDAGQAVRETYCPTLAQGRHTHRLGLVRLTALAMVDPSKGLLAHLSAADMATLVTGPYDSVTALLADARDGAIGGLMDKRGDAWLVRDQAGFTGLVDAIRIDQVPAMRQVVDLAAASLRRLGAIEAAMARYDQRSRLIGDATAQLDDLIFEGFLHAIPVQWLTRLPVWLDGLTRRLDSALRSPARDMARMDELAPVLEAYEELTAREQEPNDEVDKVGYLIEELRLQLFAQPLRPITTVSVKRLLATIDAARVNLTDPSLA